MRNQAEVRHHRERVIARRQRIIRDVFTGNWGDREKRQPGRLAKDHFCNCSCAVCCGARYRGTRAASELAWRRFEAKQRAVEALALAISGRDEQP